MTGDATKSPDRDGVQHTPGPKFNGPYRGRCTQLQESGLAERGSGWSEVGKRQTPVRLHYLSEERLPRVMEKQIRDLGWYPLAALFRDAVERLFVDAGYTVEREVTARIPGRRGRIDLVCSLGGEAAAIELDRKQPRAKSVAKLGAHPATIKLVVLREGRMKGRASWAS